MNIEETFPARYWINLGRREKRRFETEWQLEQAGITAERFPAVDARFVRQPNGYQSAGRYALALSQRLAIRKALLSGADAVLILEDDVVFNPQLRERLEAIELPDDWGIFYLGCAHNKRPRPAGQGIVRTQYALDTHAFAVRAPYYKRVIAALDARRPENQVRGHPLASDWFLADLHAEIPTYACYPNLAWQSVVESDLAGGTYSNYTATGEQIASHGELVGLQAEMWGGTRWRAEKSEPAPVECIPNTKRQPKPRLGLLFLTRGDVNQPEIWREFTREAGDGVRVFSHPKYPHQAEAGFLSGSRIFKYHETEWGDISLVRAMMALLRVALEDDSLTHFAFVSESCVPVRTWSEMSRRLKLDPRSMLGIENNLELIPKHHGRIAGVQDLPARCHRMHGQWCLLARDAAECVVETDFTDHFAGIFAPDEHYVGSVLALRGYDEEQLIARRPVTWVRWTERDGLATPQTYDAVDDQLAADLAAFPGFFARKFTATSNIGDLRLHLMEST